MTSGQKPQGNCKYNLWGGKKVAAALAGEKAQWLCQLIFVVIDFNFETNKQTKKNLFLNLSAYLNGTVFTARSLLFYSL